MSAPLDVKSAKVWRDKGPYGECLAADVELVNGYSATYSRYDTEDFWYCDSVFSKGGFPVFVHGVGSRCCLKQVAGEAVVQMLNAMVREGKIHEEAL